MAFVDAIAGRAGVNVSRELQDYGVDGTFQAVVETPLGFAGSGFTVQFQLKATVNWAEENNAIVYDLEAKAYANMRSRERSAVPLVLVVMCLPRDDRLWLRHNGRALVLKNCCYWLWLPGGAIPANRSTVRVRLPRQNLLTTAALEGILNRAREYAMGVRDDV
ncbi:MAG TPA: DUF4365 domain-containing protein [Devosiaceae bacterium]|nr:DUF4365 domain-containing protein [Devosiaceae bacterium]